MSFASDLEKFAQKTQRNIDEVIRASIISMGTQVVYMSPVDTGRFRGNWHVSIDILDRTIFADVDPSGQQTIAEISAGISDFEAGQIAYLTNNLPYAQVLEYGYSKQAPGGMVRLTVARFQSTINEAVRNIK